MRFGGNTLYQKLGRILLVYFGAIRMPQEELSGDGQCLALRDAGFAMPSIAARWTARLQRLIRSAAMGRARAYSRRTAPHGPPERPITSDLAASP